MLDAFLQRLPFLSHVAIVALCIYGPTFAPVVLASLLLFIHVILFLNNTLTIWGQYCAVRGLSQACKARSFEANDVEHVIIVPAYKEDLDTLRATLDVLASHHETRSSYHVCLAMEEREAGSEKKALQLEIEYEDTFADITHSMHPALSTEAPGKSSNVNWSTRQMASRFPASTHSNKVITVIDADTCLAQDYFQLVAESYLRASVDERTRMMFVVPIIFDRNSHDVPVFVRLTDIMWAQAGLSCTYPTSGIKIPTSVYGISMDLAVRAGFWDCGYEAIGEDLHQSVKCYLSTGGHLKVETIYSPASQLNVVGADHSKGGLRAWASDMQARYAQAMRHLWGSLDTGYALGRIVRRDFGGNKVSVAGLVNLLFRLFQAHIMLGWLLILLIRDQLSPLVSSSSVTPRALAYIAFCINGVNAIRGFSVCSSIVTMLLYERYHFLASVKRWRNPSLGSRADEPSPRSILNLFDMALIPGVLVFGIVPLFHAQFMHLFTSKLTYTVSLKAAASSKVPFAADVKLRPSSPRSPRMPKDEEMPDKSA